MSIVRPIRVLVAVLVLGAACGGDNHPGGDANNRDGNPDAPSFPSPPALGPQIDRMGRAITTTALVGTYREPPENVPPMRDIYDRASDPAAWPQTVLRGTGTGAVTIERELARNLALYDAFDKGLVMNGGCGNQALYNGGTGGAATVASYTALGTMLADDQLYIDTSKTTCNHYLSLELDVVTRGLFTHTQCGGRTPKHDVVDVTYSMFSAGVAGFEIPSFRPRIGDGVAAHTDVSETEFPFLGPPR